MILYKEGYDRGKRERAQRKLEIKIDNTVRTDIILGVIAGVILVGAFITAVVLTKRKYSDF